MQSKFNKFNKPGLFQPKYKRTGQRSNEYLSSPTLTNTNLFLETGRGINFLENTNLASTSSYRYNDKKGLFYNKEINIDYSKFENHTFFHSAIAKTNEAFDKIINKYPFDGSLKEIEIFEDSLTGYEKYILDSFPKNVGYLIFSGTQKNETSDNGTQIKVDGKEGFDNLTLAKKSSGEDKLDPILNPFMFQMNINIPEQANDNQIIFQKKSNYLNHFTLAISASNNSSKCNLIFALASGSNFNNAELSIPKGEFVHVTAMYDKTNDGKLKLISFKRDNTYNIASSSFSVQFDSLNYNNSKLTIGTGTNFKIKNNLIFIPQQTFSGSIDEFRYYKKTDNINLIKNNRNKSVNGDTDLFLYFKFNEPYGNYTGNDTVLDSSGNSLNTKIINFNINTRNSGSSSAVNGENINLSPVLFPDYPEVLNLNKSLIEQAAEYDEVNPNLITNLVPRHYFNDGNKNLNYDDEIFGKILTDFNNITDIRTSSKISHSAQLLTKFLLVWAKFFDEIKILIDNFSLLQHVNYYEKNTVANKFLKDLGMKFGMDLPDMFENATAEQLFRGENINVFSEIATRSLIEVQNMLWRRILSNYDYIKKKKGTIDAIKSIFLSAGIEVENIFDLREYGGAKIRNLNSSNKNKKDVIKFLNFSGSLSNSNIQLNYQGRNVNSPTLVGNFLSSSRREIGFPNIAGQFVNKNTQNIHGISDNTSDGLFTSSSFTYQGLYKFSKKYDHHNEQSLARIHISGTNVPSNKESCVINVIAKKKEKRIEFYLNDSITSNKVKYMYLTGVNLFDADPWAVSFGRSAPEKIKSSDMTGSYFLRASKFSSGRLIEGIYTSSFFGKDETSVLSNISAYNTSGSFIVIGSQSLNNTSGGGNFLNLAESNAKYTDFSGEVSYINFWSKNNEIHDFESYAKNPNSVGSSRPLINYNYNQLETGSFERLRIQTLGLQFTTASNDNGQIKFFDFSKNYKHLLGSGFEKNKNLITNYQTFNNYLDSNFDLNSSDNKIRIRSLQDEQLVNNHIFSTTTPVYEVLPSEEVFDDTRFSIDMSVMKGLNENIMTMFSNFQPIDDALGFPNNLFSSEYKDIISYRRMYFNNLLNDLNITKYRTLFKWIDNAFTDLVYGVIPRTTNFLGINFIYESHVLERHRIEYLYDEIYLKSFPRNPERVKSSDARGKTYEGSLSKFKKETSRGSLDQKETTTTFYRATVSDNEESASKSKIKKVSDSYRKQKSIKKFVDKPGSGTKSNIGIEKARSKGKKLTSPSQQRIGIKSNRKNYQIKQNVEDKTLKGTHISRIKIIGSNSENKIDRNLFYSGKSGKDIKTIQEDVSIIPRISLSYEGEADAIGEINSKVDSSLFGLGQNISIRAYKPFKDFIGVFNPVSFIKNNGKIMMYPSIANIKEENTNYYDIDANQTDGAIEVFPIRYDKNNLGIADIRITGIKGLIGAGDWNLSDHNSDISKGSPLIENIIEINKNKNDWFEDSQDIIIKGTFPKKGNINSSGYYMTTPGIISVGKNTTTPFDDSDSFKNKYSHLTNEEKTNLLKASGRDVSEIGTRYKSSQAGFMSDAFHSKIESKNFGTDSISFLGLTKG